ncbi:MAG: site-2 protease family protein [Fuerstiella sp.]
MNKSYRIGTAAGIPLFLHWSFLLIPAYILFSGLAMGRPPFGMLADSLLVTVIFTCVVLHELGHALAARRFGVRTKDIVLMPIGGVARLERMPKRPVEELLVALAGPAVNVVIAAILLAITVPVIGVDGLLNPSSLAANLAGRTILVNLAMIVFNMLPAFPLDGGRVLRSLLAMNMDHLKATRIAAKAGQTMAVLLGLAGLFVVNNPMLVFIAGFVFLGAAQEAGSAETEASLTGLKVRDAMMTRFDAVPVQASAAWALRFAMATNKSELPVTSSGQFRGMLRTEDAGAAVADGQPGLSVGFLCHTDVGVLRPEDPLTEALPLLQQGFFSAVPVVDEDGHLEGMVTRNCILAARRFGPLMTEASSEIWREGPDELVQHLARMQVG